MDEDKIREQLAKLHAELSDAHREDPVRRSGLSEILPEVKRVAEGSVDLDTANAALPGRLEQVAVQFEADHPALADSLRRIVDLLAEVGI